ncbi:Rict-1 [Aphelenchoides besseyi]|nr:Rict-1 [Aphelenchoides besseyi]
MATNDTIRVLRIQSSAESRLRVKVRGKSVNIRSRFNDYQEETETEELVSCLKLFDQNKNYETEEFDQLLKLLNLLKNATKEQREDDRIFDDFLNRIGYRLCSDLTNNRAAMFRILRYLLTTADRLHRYVEQLVDVFVVRSLDTLILSKEERLEALDLAAQMLLMHVRSTTKINVVQYSSFPRSIMKCIYAVAVQRLVFTETGESEPKLDDLNKASIAVLLEVAAIDPLFTLEVCGSDWIPRILIQPGVDNLAICSLVCKVLSVWLDDPEIRKQAKLQLIMEQIFSPLLDLGFFHRNDQKVRNVQKVTRTLETCSTIFLNLMRSWPGLFACSSTELLCGSVASPLKLLSYLGQVTSTSATNLTKIREMVIDVCCEFVSMPYSGKTFVDWNDAALFYCKNLELIQFTIGLAKIHLPDQYECSIRDDFIVGELNSVFVHGASDINYVDLLLSFRALATFILINYGLAQSLARLILMNPNEPLALKATLLLGDLLRTSVSFVPKNWKQLLLSTPMLIQLLTQSMLNTVASSKKEQELLDSETVIPNVENTIILLQRLEELSTISQCRTSYLSQLKLANLFILPNKPGYKYFYSTRFTDDDAELESRCSEAISNALADTNHRWLHVDYVLRAFHKIPHMLSRWQHNDKCHTFFVQIIEFFAPKHQMFLKDGITTEIVRSGESAFVLIVKMAQSEPYYMELLENYVADFCRELTQENLYTGTFMPRNILHTNAFLYFGIMSAIGSSSFGYRLLEKSGFYQLCLDLITQSSASSIEYIKLVISSLNYNGPEITRIILETALTATDESGRKWTTRFMEVLLLLDVIPDFEDYGMRLLFQQLADPSAKIIRSAVEILSRWLPKYPNCRRQLKKVRLESLGDAGVLLDAHLQSDEECVRFDIERARQSLQHWMDGFNEQYVQIVEEEMRLALTNYKRSMSGNFARQSTNSKACHQVRTPFHILAALASHSIGQQLIQDEEVISILLSQLRADLTPQRSVEVKSALLAISHIVGVLDEKTANELLPEDTVEVLCDYAESCQILSVRGIAFFAINIAAQSAWGVRQLTKLNWEANRHWKVQDEVFNDDHDQQSNSNDQVKSRKKEDTLDVPDDDSEIRKSRSNSMYTRAGNETMTTRKPRPSPSRRRNTSTSLSQQQKPSLMKTDRLQNKAVEEDGESVGLEWEELGLDLELLKPFMDDSIKPEEILIRKALKKNDKPNFTDSYAMSTQHLQRHFVSFVSGIGIYDKFWFLTDTERDELIEYRNVLQKAAGRLRLRIRPKKEMLQVALRQSPAWSKWTCVAMPNEMSLISQAIFNSIDDHLKVSTESKETNEVQKNEHDTQKCPYCLFNLKSPKSVGSFLSSLFTNLTLTDKHISDYAIRRDDILNTMTMLEVREALYQTRLANHYRDSSAFEHPCMYWDAISLLNELDQSVEVRSFIQQLHWRAIAQLAEPKKPTAHVKIREVYY